MVPGPSSPIFNSCSAPWFERRHNPVDLVDQLFNSSEKRLARILLLLAHLLSRFTELTTKVAEVEGLHGSGKAG